MSRLAHFIITLVIAVSSASAGAAIVTGGFSGQIFSGSDFGSGPGGFFGVGSDLSDQFVTGTFRYDTAQVPPGIPSSPGRVRYSDPTFSTEFLNFTVTINGRTYVFGLPPAPPGIQEIIVDDPSNALDFDYQRNGVNLLENVALSFISDIDFLANTDVPTHFDFVASGVGLFPTGFFLFDLPSGASANARFDLTSGFARIAAVPEPGTLMTLALGLLGIGRLRRRASR